MTSSATRRVLFALPGMHRVRRGAEIAFESVATEMASLPRFEITVAGSGPPIPGRPYRFLHVPCVPRERFERAPTLPVLRSNYAYEELTWIPGLLLAYAPGDFDITVTCSFPFTNWALRSRLPGRRRPAHVYVTQNGDWPARSRDREFRLFGCDGLVCTNPDYYERNRSRWRSVLVPNGVDASRFAAGPARREHLGLPPGAPVALTVSALIPSKRAQPGSAISTSWSPVTANFATPSTPPARRSWGSGSTG
jgi:glycosyltransferase involved in cell wall biosynthesis